MDAVALTVESLIEILLDSRKRAALLSAMQAETGFDLPITNKYHELALRCNATSQQLEKAVNVLLQCQPQNDVLIDPLVYHPNISEKVLFNLLQQKRCISSLGHRSGPRRLLEKLAAEHAYSEAITTLAFEYYGLPDADINQFAEFITKHINDPMLRWNIENTTRLPEKKQTLALKLLLKYNQSKQQIKPFWRFIEIFSEFLKKAKKRDWLPQIAAIGLGLATGNHVFEWIFRQTTSSSKLITEWAETPIIELFERVSTAAVFFLIVLLAKRIL